jgi:hypothetical protein
VLSIEGADFTKYGQQVTGSVFTNQLMKGESTRPRSRASGKCWKRPS